MKSFVLAATAAFSLSSIGVAEATTLFYDDAGRATAISDLVVGSQTYQVEFSYDYYGLAYLPGQIFSNAELISSAIVGVLEGETTTPLIGTNGTPFDPDLVQASRGFVLPSSASTVFVTRCPSAVYTGGSSLNDGGYCTDGYNETETMNNLKWEMFTMWTVVSGGNFEDGGPLFPSYPIPLPSSIVMLVSGLGGFGWLRRRKGRLPNTCQS